MRIAPGGTVGILGGGQLGRMLAQAAKKLGYRTVVLTPETDSPASQVADETIVAPYKREEALKEFADKVDVMTYEFENIPIQTVLFASKDKPVQPSAPALKTSQNRLDEKTFLNRIGVPTTPFAAVQLLDDLVAEAPLLGFPCVLKTQRGGYDGKGQVLIRERREMGRAHAEMMGQPSIIEAFVEFTRELSIICVRGASGAILFYPVVENEHRNHILFRTLAPAEISDRLEQRAQTIASKIAEGLDYIGVLTVEMFETVDGGLLVNEIAPRVHNSGHWTIEACKTSQFENHIRAICGLPLGQTTQTHRAVMTNLIGDDIDKVPEWEAQPQTTVHLYGKAEARPGRKMGHVTQIFPLDD
ncbi:5-(carboxyamino)imidazole ribonucleotide synthase [Iodidimonas sp. SYSU 1G8]|uniref:5-(carboxyamino)imidazole ribonucleotide synthase n=1 Tax=Iodidimonas sp. SYSU 1G8 TaxID=3133967 RepID=UPI0031FEEAB2